MADGKSRLPVFIDRFGLQKPFDAKLCKGAPDVVATALTRAFGKSTTFEVVRSQPRERGFDISGTVQNLEYDDKKKTMKAKLSIVLAETPGRSYFGNITKSAAIDGVNPRKMEAAVEELVEALAEAGAGDAVRQCERKAAAR